MTIVALASAATASRATRYRPELQGLRALAITLIVVYHVWLNRVSGGVDVFFLLSGFLLTGQLLRAAVYAPDPPWVWRSVPPNVTFLDLSDQLCGSLHCPAEIGNVLVYMDDNHLRHHHGTGGGPARGCHAQLVSGGGLTARCRRATGLSAHCGARHGCVSRWPGAAREW